MKIVMVHKFFHMTGGTEKYFRDLSSILADHGDETIPFALKHPDNPSTPYAEYFLEGLDYSNTSKVYRLRNTIRILARTLYSCEARNKIEALVRDSQPDLAHLQSIEHHISPSILHSLHKYKVPIVQSINTYKPVCGSYRMYSFDRNETCEQCLYGKHYRAALTRCVKGSLSASILVMMEMYLHSWMRIYDLVDRFIVPNRFIAEKLVAAGHPETKIVRLLNPLHLTAYEPSYQFDDYVLYFGRIDPEKGVGTLVRAMKRLPTLKLVVVGTGTEVEGLLAWVRESRLENVEFVGPKWGDDLKPYLSRARLVVVPSLWYEPSPMVIYESFATGKPVIASRIGGIPELVTEDTGVLCEPGNPDDLADRIAELASDDRRLRTMGHAARRWAEESLDPEDYYQSLMEVYMQAREARTA